MKNRAAFPSYVWLALLPLGGCTGDRPVSGAAQHGPATVITAAESGLSISGPHEHENLRVWLVHGADRLPSDREVVPLEEALAKELCVVHETGDVNELAIENVSDEVDVYVQSGDIVQGGKQDRTIGVDLVLAPKSGRVPLPSFCVEQGRWSARGATAQRGVGQLIADTFSTAGGGVTSLFSSSRNSLATNELKKAVLLDVDQGKVWQEVSSAQGRLASNASSYGEVVDDASPSSLELTLNTGAVQTATVAYVEALGGILAGRDDAVGCVVAINGRLYGADVYGSHALFSRLWPKLLRGSATAAVAQKAAEGPAQAPTLADVEAFLLAPRGDADRRQVGAGISIAVTETACNHVVESRAAEGALVHTTYLAK